MGTRHNLGFRVVDELARRHDIAVTRRQFQSLIGSGLIADRPAMLVKPQTFMNDSGRAVRSLVQFRKIALGRVVIVYDDVDLSLGRVRVRPGGSAGGHHGVMSIIKEIGASDFDRVRVGIGRPPERDVTDFVLSPFHSSELEIVEQAIVRAADAVEQLVLQGVEQAMQVVNR